jgi:heme-degrading monooxygenase HmoA
VEWRIKKGREQEFLDYWSTRATVEDRSGLIGEFLSKVEDQKQYPWMVWDLDPAYTTYVNVGFWRDGDAFQQQIGRFIDNSKPPQDFEAQKRRRVLVAPERWRIGATPWTFTDHPSVR